MKKKVRKPTKKTRPVTIDSDQFRPFDPDTESLRKFEKNMAAFKTKFPELASKLAALKSTATTLIVSENSEFDIEFQGEKFFHGGSRTWAEERVKGFEKKPMAQRLTAATLDSANLDEVANQAIFRFTKQCVETHGMKFATGPVDKFSFHLIVLGVGLGDHLPLLVENTDCRNLILFEPNLEFLFHSMFAFDWSKLIDDFDMPGRRLWLYTERTAPEIAIRVRDAIRYMGPNFADGSFIFQAYPSSILEQAMHEISAQKNFIVSGMGFLEDEFDMIRNVHLNFKKFKGRIYKKPSDAARMPAFVVASGPSLDNDIDFLKNNQSRAIIISCGTTLRILLNHGIIPDIHVEMENVSTVSDVMELLAKDHDMSDILLLAANTVDQNVSSFFKNVVYYSRVGPTSELVFPLDDTATLSMSSPSVSNLGFALACDIGFTSIYLFGVDFGARDPHQHHAKGAVYDTGEIESGVSSDDLNIVTPANFGGTVLSEYIFLWSKDMVENKVNFSNNLSQIYNCSDGVRLEGITPKLSAAVTLSEDIDKQKFISELLLSFPQYPKEHFKECWDKEKLRNDIKVFRNQLLECCDAPKIDDIKGLDESQITALTQRDEFAKEDFSYLIRLTDEIIPLNRPASAPMLFFRGSVFLMLTAVHFYANRVRAGAARTKLAEIGRKEISEQCVKIASYILCFYDYMDGVSKNPPPVGAYKNLIH